MNKELLQQALDALENAENSLGSFVSDHGWSQSDMDIMDNTTATIIAVKRALAQPEQNPVGRFARFCDGLWREVPEYVDAVMLYASPPQRQPLTHEQRVDLLTAFEQWEHEWNSHAILIDMVEAAHNIKEKEPT